MSDDKTKSKRGVATRAAAAFTVDQVLSKGRSLDRALSLARSNQLPVRDQALVKALAFGALRWHHRHRLIIRELLDRPLRSRDHIIEALLSVGLFQLIDMRQPGYASVSATVEATRELQRPRAASLVNATLRRFQREQDTLLATVLDADEGRYSHPQWLIDCLRADWNGRAQQILTSALIRPPMWLRLNLARVDAAAYVKALQSEHGIGVTRLAGLPTAICLEQPLSIDELPGFTTGLVSVQDAGAQFAAALLDATPGMRVLDACAAPGGKTGHILERGGGQLEVIAVDIDANRNAMIRQNLERIGYTAEVITADAEQPWPGDSNARGSFDRILVDAPCSATGVIRRHPDIKFLRRYDDIGVFAARQGRLLDALWPLLKPGGRLLYATCSVLRVENHEVIGDFLRRQPKASEIRLSQVDMPETVVAESGPGYQLLPGPANTDGFYYALMERST
ncbi:MAG: 16S rRNA (cytosine(967)-C(5))-methyltransferase RsmB [Gammaproteobacteria bacterium]|jgi:16S rRNA (cytosine967-C5)-methyltransferase|nr:16S rRNA (cytosine(967)-C(5))-methyltransferase [Chromatiales bacterium]MCP4924369.1 16S rRNA (cytosine(967)-C(5))-methyltransferase RsmB [Gammaproteobacteria bacterium]MDP7153495.1 16S rRNA (cytosine(967)-C(5))-methyltransferase RsmB [Gammaproteobacteria bacterium]MDP7295813.1 16S rRNA (cytosine(967)-C(5))-methyltransferase RsmB [Gammaproteobacteria bacterium]MDP7419745.1 16S rRNA (cytosine(967)-C(5))-methyltransferase RsmB [Gammaproteobacteria bacterium]